MTPLIRFAHGTPLGGTVNAVSSKSDVLRLLLCASLAGDPVSVLYTGMLSDDVRAAVRCLTALGADIRVSDGCLAVQKGLSLPHLPHGAVLDCGESAAVARFLLPLAACFAPGARFTGSGRLPERPLAPLCRALEEHGARFSAHTLPLTVLACASLNGGFSVPCDVTSQYLSALLFLLPLGEDISVRRTTPPVSARYIDMTTDRMRLFGVDTVVFGDRYTAVGQYRAPAATLRAEGDYSSAAFFLCAASPGHPVTVMGLEPITNQGDRRILSLLSEMGASVSQSADAVTVSVECPLHGIETDVSDVPDLVPPLAVRAAASFGKTVLHGTGRLRMKESDRVAGLSRLLTSLGASVRTTDDDIFIEGHGSLIGGTPPLSRDHRLFMAAAVAAVFCDKDVFLPDDGSFTKSYPTFLQDYATLAGGIL